MGQQSSGIGFREVDPEGNPVEATLQAGSGESPPGGTATAVNPFIVVLWLLAILLIGGGVLIFVNANSLVGPSTSGMPASFLMLTFAPYAMAVGLAAAICLLFWHAFQWQRRRRS